MTGQTNVPLPLPPGTTTIRVEVPQRTPQWWDPSIYAPAVPGILVALLGLLIAHRLTQAREMRKEIADRCDRVKKLADEAADSAMAAWLAGAGSDRKTKIVETKRRLHALGIAATDLSRRRALRLRLRFKRAASVNVLPAVVSLRRAATADPFEDPTREADDSHIGRITHALGEVHIAVDNGFFELYH